MQMRPLKSDSVHFRLGPKQDLENAEALRRYIRGE